MEKQLTRTEVPVQLTWNLADIFPNFAAWEKALEELPASLPAVTKFKGRLGEGPEILFDCLEASEQLVKKLYRVLAYASLLQAGDGTDPVNQAATGRAGALAARFQAETSFIRSEALALPQGTLEGYLEQDNRLKEFERSVNQMIEAKLHTLGPETEVALASLGEVLSAPSMIYNRSKAADMAFEPVVDSRGRSYPVSFPAYEEKYETATDTILRRNAFASFTKVLIPT
jgi:oligoendopeptidase F